MENWNLQKKLENWIGDLELHLDEDLTKKKKNKKVRRSNFLGLLDHLFYYYFVSFSLFVTKILIQTKPKQWRNKIKT